MNDAPDVPKNKGGRPRNPTGTPKRKRAKVKAKARVVKPAAAPSARAVKENRALVHARLYAPILPDGEVVSSIIERVGEANKRIPDEIRRLIVELNACRRTPTETARFILEMTGFDVTANECSYYDPTKRQGAGLKHEWRVLFDDTRRAYDAHIANINLSQLSWRLGELQALYDMERAKPRPNVMLLLKILEQGARDSSGAFGRAGGCVGAETEKPSVILTDR